ncbi:hypothetical protein [Glycomyces xiaoerkulensis]|uniref:hypothetical protein n=1 Tax=Glycomyces xiaoerkulensis TaxID=2038139 RepID=UPI0012FFD503|nr:hypothetical protein [Glycomyces xiaoerkulensis]
MYSSDLQLKIRVEGMPPAKREALSMFSPQHPHRDRLAALRRAAREAMSTGVFDPFSRIDRIGMEVIVANSVGEVYDAADYLGGIADALQPPPLNVPDLSHLGDLADVTVYPDDGMIHRVQFELVDAKSSAYEVRLWKI